VFVAEKRRDPRAAPSVIILSGPASVGKRTAARGALLALMCESSKAGDACCEPQCPSCEKAAHLCNERCIDCRDFKRQDWLRIHDELQRHNPHVGLTGWILDNVDEFGGSNDLLFQLLRTIDLAPPSVIFFLIAEDILLLSHFLNSVQKRLRFEEFTIDDKRRFVRNELQRRNIPASEDGTDLLASHSDPNAHSILGNILECAPNPGEVLTFDSVARDLDTPRQALVNMIVCACVGQGDLRTSVTEALQKSTLRNLNRYAREHLLNAVMLSHHEVEFISPAYTTLLEKLTEAFGSSLEDGAARLARAFTAETHDDLLFSLYSIKRSLQKAKKVGRGVVVPRGWLRKILSKGWNRS